MRLLRLLKRELSSEARAWITAGIVTEEQARRILTRYGAQLPDGSERSAGYLVLLSLAALFAGLSILVFVSANWEEIPRPVRMLSLAGLTLAFHGAGAARERAGAASTASVWYLLGCITYGTSIFLIAQIYHLGEHYPDGIWWWAVGVLPFALLVPGAATAWLLAAVSLAWLVSETRETFLPASWPLFAAALFWLCFRRLESALLFLVTVAATGFWLEVLVARLLSDSPAFAPAEEHVPLTLGLVVLTYALGRWMETQTGRARSPEYGLVLRLWSLRLCLLMLLIFSFEESWLGIMDLHYRSPGFVIGWLLLVLVATGGLVFRLRPGGDARARLEAGLSALACLAFFALVVLVSLLTREKSRELALALQVLDNLACIGAGVWLILRALRDSVSLYFYTGIGLILIVALLRYADLVGDYVGGSLLFLFFAGVLYASARFWRAHARGGAPR